MPKKQTHCGRGHLLAGDNLLWRETDRGRRDRRCRTCNTERNRGIILPIAQKRQPYKADPTDSDVLCFREEAAKRGIRLLRCS